MTEGPPRYAEIDPNIHSPLLQDVLKRAIAGRGRVPTPFKVWLHSEKLADAIEHLGTMLNTQSSLSEREFELAIVLIAQHWESPFVIDAHLRFVSKAGMPAPTVEALKARYVPYLETEREKAIYEIFKAFDRKDVATDEVFNHAVKHLGRNGLAELLAFLGYYTAVAMAMKLHREPVPEA
ncbi:MULTISPECIES: hypothetical protein [unclassified Beijerinckia]|uniref:carboxymuconolactone decarboxylase family protein n=1 Tax=unclassified Beijerinckia TaxID=2638183 RepID=UPI00089B2D32|nr:MULTISPECIES: hypothetical protein [unclassified Beijerinckia]MDH7799137.1 4-carboxymuconolactone decarboxylase [Beijerinckia sp. GAS462]SED93918.1 4-carboxymuconolactone decarboxylase [Beijerinckia sp. 28-YEA-48]